MNTSTFKNKLNNLIAKSKEYIEASKLSSNDVKDIGKSIEQLKTERDWWKADSQITNKRNLENIEEIKILKASIEKLKAESTCNRKIETELSKDIEKGKDHVLKLIKQIYELEKMHNKVKEDTSK